MNKIEELEQKLFDEKIEVDYCSIKNRKALSFIDEDYNRSIAIDLSKVGSKAEKHVILTHEYVHHNQPKTMYNFDNSIYAIRRRENKVNRDVIKRLVPQCVLSSSLKAGKYLYEIAEELEITEQLLHDAINYYKDLEAKK